MIAALLTALVLVPNLSVSGKTLKWSAAGSSGSYRVQEKGEAARRQRPRGRDLLHAGSAARRDGQLPRAYVAQRRMVEQRDDHLPRSQNRRNRAKNRRRKNRPKKNGRKKNGRKKKNRLKNRPPKNRPSKKKDCPKNPRSKNTPATSSSGVNAGYWGSSEPRDLQAGSARSCGSTNPPQADALGSGRAASDRRLLRPVHATRA